MMYIKCVDISGTAFKRLTLLKEYEIIEISNNTEQYKIYEDDGRLTYWNMNRFKEVV